MADSFTSTAARPSPAQPADKTPASQSGTFKISDIRDDDVVLVDDEGRAFTATVKDDLDGLRRGSTVSISHDGMDKSGAPTNAVVTSKAAD